MSLTLDEKQELIAVLERTRAHRETGKIEKIIPEDYRFYQEQVIRETIALEVPSVGAAVTCYITTAKNKTIDCPVHVNMHGGGFVFLQDEDDDRYCAHVAARIQGIVVDIDYASSLEYPYPVALEQSYEVMRWVFTQCSKWGASTKKVSMGGQ